MYRINFKFWPCVHWQFSSDLKGFCFVLLKIRYKIYKDIQQNGLSFSNVDIEVIGDLLKLRYSHVCLCIHIKYYPGSREILKFMDRWKQISNKM